VPSVAVKRFPALDIPESDELILAVLDDFAPTAVEDRETGARVYFATPERREAARAELAARNIESTAIDVPDDDWASRSQQHLAPIIVGRLLIVSTPESQIPDPESLVKIAIRPSMGFGTGHHASTRLCLAALQQIDLTGAAVLDVGTGSGILAIAAWRLGARSAIGVDSDADAVQSAEENVALNQAGDAVVTRLADFASDLLPTADVVLANLTGATIVKFGGRLVDATREGGTLIVSGVLAQEEAEVRRSLSAEITERLAEDEWVCLRVKKR
jgi:ribosomal protein L11 methyltransferase